MSKENSMYMKFHSGLRKETLPFVEAQVNVKGMPNQIMLKKPGSHEMFQDATPITVRFNCVQILGSSCFWMNVTSSKSSLCRCQHRQKCSRVTVAMPTTGKKQMLSLSLGVIQDTLPILFVICIKGISKSIYTGNTQGSKSRYCHAGGKKDRN